MWYFYSLFLTLPPLFFFLSCGCLPLMDIPRTIPKAERRTGKVTPPHKSRWSYGAWRCHCVEGLAAVTLLQRHPPSYVCYYDTARSPLIIPSSVRSACHQPFSSCRTQMFPLTDDDQINSRNGRWLAVSPYLRALVSPLFSFLFFPVSLPSIPYRCHS